MVTNTIPQGMAKYKSDKDTKMKVGMLKAIEALRTEIITGAGQFKNFPVVTGRYKNSLAVGGSENITTVEAFPNGIQGTLGTMVPYSKFVEFGTSRQKAQLNWTLGLQRARSKIQDIFKTALKH